MTLKDIIAKVTKGEALTEEDKALLAGLDIDKLTNDAAAAARRKSEQRAAELEAQAQAAEKKAADAEAKLQAAGNAGKTELQKLQADFSTAAKQLENLQAQVAKSEGEKAQLMRKQALADIRRARGIQFADGLDHSMLENSFTAALDGADLADEAVVKLKVTTWAAMNKAAILDQSGHGAGGQPRVGNDSTAESKRKSIEDMTPEQRQADMKKKNLV